MKQKVLVYYWKREFENQDQRKEIFVLIVLDDVRSFLLYKPGPFTYETKTLT